MLRAVLIVLAAIIVFTIANDETPPDGLNKNQTNLLLKGYITGSYNKLEPINASKISQYDFAPLFIQEDSFMGCYLGYIGADFWRLHITFDEIKKIAPLKYSAKGKTMTKGNYCDFEGEIAIDRAYRYKEPSVGLDGEMEGLVADEGVIFAKVILRENDKQKGGGVFQGDLMTNWYIDANNTLRYDNIESYSDSFANNQFLGVWTSYKTGAQKRVAWGQYSIPASGDLDLSACCFEVNAKYINNGWQTKKVKVFACDWRDNCEYVMRESYCYPLQWRKK